MDKRPCQATASHGAACRAWAPDGSTYCRVHDPVKAEEVQAARIRGAKKAGQLRLLQGRRVRLDNPRALASFLSGLIHDLAEGKRDPELVKVIAYACSVQRGVVELAQKSELEARLLEVERLLAQRRPS